MKRQPFFHFLFYLCMSNPKEKNASGLSGLGNLRSRGPVNELCQAERAHPPGLVDQICALTQFASSLLEEVVSVVQSTEELEKCLDPVLAPATPMGNENGKDENVLRTKTTTAIQEALDVLSARLEELRSAIVESRAGVRTLIVRQIVQPI